MRYYPNAGAALEVVSPCLPAWARELPGWSSARAYFDAVPVDFSVFGFGLECHLVGDRIDAGVAFPVSEGRHELLVENLEQLRSNLDGDRDPVWDTRVLEPAARISALDRLLTRGIRAYCLCMDHGTLDARACPDLVYLSLHNLHILRDPSQLLWCPPIARVVEALFGARPAVGVELLERMRAGAGAWPGLRLAHLGVARVEAGGRLKPYFHGRLPELGALLRSPALPRPAGFDAPLELLDRLAAVNEDEELTVMLGTGAALDRVDVEVHPGPCFEAALDLAREAGAAPARLAEVRAVAAAEIQRVQHQGWVPVAARLTHVKVSLRAGRAPSWKAYFVIRQAS